jgi:hypothetical protein
MPTFLWGFFIPNTRRATEMNVGETHYNLSAKYQLFSWRRQSKETSFDLGIHL